MSVYFSPSGEPSIASIEQRQLLSVQETELLEKLRTAMCWTNGKPQRPARLRMHHGAVIEVWNIENACAAILRREATLIEQETATAPTGGVELR